MNFSPNFTLDELTATNTGYYNVPNQCVQGKLLYLATYILQPIRDKWGRLDVTSGYRSGAVNVAVGGSGTSQHLEGEAVDIIPAETDIEIVFNWIVQSEIKFGQCILEVKGEGEKRRRWIHVSLPRINKVNNKALVYDGEEYQPYITIA